MTVLEYLSLVGYAWTCGDCGDHPMPFTSDDIEEVLEFAGGCGCGPLNSGYETCNSYCGSDSFAIFKLKDGRYATFWESSDSSGHG